MKRVMRMKTMNWLAAVVLSACSLQANNALAQMDQGEKKSQGGSAPADARDPHAYSDGFSLTASPYVQSGSPQLKLADEHSFWAVLGDRFEYRENSKTGSEIILYDLQAWYGTTFDRLVIKAEGDIASGTLEESSTELLWSHAVNAYFNTQLGLRFDQYRKGKDRQWLGLGLQGLAPYWFEVDVTAYVGDNGRTALAAQAEYELLLTQRLILQPRAELNLYGKDDPENGLGSGLSDLALGVRLRYEYSRQFSPYIGVEWTGTYGDTADYRRAEGQNDSDTQIVAGLRFWF